MKSPFKVIDLPFGEWAVVWTELLVSREFRFTPNGSRALNIIFNEMKHTEATLGVLTNLTNGCEVESLRIDCGAYYQSRTQTEDFISNYVVGGAVFNNEDDALHFLKLAEQHYLVAFLAD